MLYKLKSLCLLFTKKLSIVSLVTVYKTLTCNVTSSLSQEDTNSLAEAYKALKARDIQQACDRFEKVINEPTTSASDKARAFFGLANTFMSQGDAHVAIECLDRAQLQLKVDKVQDQAFLGQIYFLLYENYRWLQKP